MQGNNKASVDDVEVLIKAAEGLRDLVKQLSDTDDIKGYIVYRT